jgi:hypothetical protein
MYVLDEKLGRRKFLKATAAIAGGTAIASTYTSCRFRSAEHPIATDPAAKEQWGREAGQWIPSLYVRWTIRHPRSRRERCGRKDRAQPLESK